MLSLASPHLPQRKSGNKKPVVEVRLKQIYVLEWFSQSLDLNLIENLQQDFKIDIWRSS